MGLKEIQLQLRKKIMEQKKKKVSSYREKKKKAREIPCHCCGASPPFSWRCRCGFTMCQDCMDENFWGISCNGITWDCPDCGAQNGFGNQ